MGKEFKPRMARNETPMYVRPYLEDPLWLDVDDPRFGKMAELGRIVRVGFVPEVPGYCFHRHFKGSGHPFYEAVYAKAVKINKKLADNMETCICR